MTVRQVSVFIENRTGRINEVTRILADRGINMTAFSLAENAEFGILRMIVSDVDAAIEALRGAHLGVSATDVVCLCCPNRPGAMASILEALARENVFIEYMYAFSQGETANVVIRPTDMEKCIEVLVRYKFELLDKKSLCQK